MKKVVVGILLYMTVFSAYANCAGRILHVGGGKICMQESAAIISPALCIGIEDRKYCVPLNAGNVGRLHVMLNGGVYSVPDFMNVIESVRFDGMSYIDLGFVATTDLNFEIRADLDESVSYRDGALLGVRTSMLDQYVIWYNNLHGSNLLAPRLFADKSADDFNNLDVSDGPITMRWENNSFTIDGVAQDVEYFTMDVNQSDDNLHLGGLMVPGGVDSRRFLGDIYYAKFWDSTGVIMDLVAATDADGVPGMYDKVTGRMLYLKH